MFEKFDEVMEAANKHRKAFESAKDDTSRKDAAKKLVQELDNLKKPLQDVRQEIFEKHIDCRP